MPQPIREMTAFEYRMRAIHELGSANTDGNPEWRATLSARRAQVYADLAVSKATEEFAEKSYQGVTVLEDDDDGGDPKDGDDLVTRGKGAPDVEARLLTLDQAANYLGLSSRSLWRATQAREVAVVRLGRLLRFDPADLDAFVAASRIKVNAASASDAEAVTGE